MAEQDFRGPGAPGYDSLDDESDLGLSSLSDIEASPALMSTSGSPVAEGGVGFWLKAHSCKLDLNTSPGCRGLWQGTT